LAKGVFKGTNWGIGVGWLIKPNFKGGDLVNLLGGRGLEERVKGLF